MRAFWEATRLEIRGDNEGPPDRLSTKSIPQTQSSPPVKAVLSSALRQTQVTALLCGFFRTMGLPREGPARDAAVFKHWVCFTRICVLGSPLPLADLCRVFAARVPCHKEERSEKRR